MRETKLKSKWRRASTLELDRESSARDQELPSASGSAWELGSPLSDGVCLFLWPTNPAECGSTLLLSFVRTVK